MNSQAADSLRRRVAELLVLRASGHLSDQQRRYPQWELSNSEMQRLLQEGVGGVILLGGSAVELQQRTQQLEGWSNKRLLFCGLHECCQLRRDSSLRFLRAGHGG